MKVILLATLLLMTQVGACFSRPGEITLLSEIEPLSIRVHGGTEQVMWIWFQGPYRNATVQGPAPPPSKRDIDVIVWKIRLAAKDGVIPFVEPDKIPDITYGQVPEGWEQELPEAGTPPPLLDGYVYTVGVVTHRGPAPRSLCVYVNKGSLEPYKDKTDPPCDEE